MRVWTFRIALSLVATLALILVARNAAVQTFNAYGVALPLKPAPDDAVQSLLRARLLQVDLLKTDIDLARGTAATRNADRIDPLEYRTFLVAGLMARKGEDIGRAAALLEAARSRQPRNFNIRRLLLEIYLLDGQYEKAAGEILASVGVSTTDPRPLLQALAYLSKDSEARTALSNVFVKRSDWRRRFITSEAVVGIAPDMIFEIAANKATPMSDRRAAIRALADGEEIPLAYRLWTLTPPYTGYRQGEFPVDPGFDGLAQNSGFGWNLSTSSEGVAELLEDGNAKGKYLDVEYFGGGAVTLVEQPMLLAPGRYQLSIAGRNIGGVDGAGSYRWTIICTGAKDPIAIVRIGSADDSKFEQAASFVVPSSGCAVQSLQMMILPGELSRSMRSNFTNVGISRQ